MNVEWGLVGRLCTQSFKLRDSEGGVKVRDHVSYIVGEQ